MVQIAEEIEPNHANSQAYDDQYGCYLATYTALQPLMHELAEKK